jgi:hypothetical protein
MLAKIGAALQTSAEARRSHANLIFQPSSALDFVFLTLTLSVTPLLSWVEHDGQNHHFTSQYQAGSVPGATKQAAAVKCFAAEVRAAHLPPANVLPFLRAPQAAVTGPKSSPIIWSATA